MHFLTVGRCNLQTSCHITAQSACTFASVLKEEHSSLRRNELRSYPYNSTVRHKNLITINDKRKKKHRLPLGKYYHCAYQKLRSESNTLDTPFLRTIFRHDLNTKWEVSQFILVHIFLCLCYLNSVYFSKCLFDTNRCLKTKHTVPTSKYERKRGRTFSGAA